MSRTFRVRFRPSKNLTVVNVKPVSITQVGKSGKGVDKSKNGCRECRRRRVKCDEVLPICLRCQRRRTICLSSPRTPTWLQEIPGITIPKAPEFFSAFGPYVDRRLLRSWFEQTSQIMVLDPEINPLSYPILQLLVHSPWIAPVLQSISAGYENDYNPKQIAISLTHRQQALTLFRQDILSPNKSLVSTLIGILLLGLSSSWIDGDASHFGQEHFFGARTIFNLLLCDQKREKDAIELFAVGAYIYWDMTCSFLIDHSQQLLFDISKVLPVVQEVAKTYHPMCGVATELFYWLGHLGRYCRLVLDTGQRDVTLELLLEEKLLCWKSPEGNLELSMLGEAFRHHGLIQLYRICDMPGEAAGSSDSPDATDQEQLIHSHAIYIIKVLGSIPLTSSYISYQAMPLLTAGSELVANDEREREEVLVRYGALYATNRTPPMKWAVELLREHWDLREKGIRESWVQLMLRKGWRLALG